MIHQFDKYRPLLTDIETKVRTCKRCGLKQYKTRIKLFGIKLNSYYFFNNGEQFNYKPKCN